MSIKADALYLSCKLEEDETANDSDKTFTVPSGKLWVLIWCYIEYTASADVGNRYLYFRITDASDDVLLSLIGYTITASQTKEFKLLSAGGINVSTDGQNMYSLPYPCVLLAGEKIRIYDSAAVAAAADDMLIHMRVAEIDV